MESGSLPPPAPQPLPPSSARAPAADQPAEADQVVKMSTPSKVELSAAELEGLREAGLEPRAGVLGLYLLRNRHGIPIAPAEAIVLEGELKAKAEAMRDELASQLLEKGTEGLPLLGGKPDLRGVWLPGADLGGAQLQEAILWQAQLQKADLRGAQLQKADLRWAQLREANLSGAQLQEAKLTGGELQKANLKQAQLQKANLTKAQLQEANLEEAQLHEAKLDGVAPLLHKALRGGSGVELSAAELEGLREVGLEPRAGVLGLYLLREKDCGNIVPIVPAEAIMLEGELKAKAEAMRDELASQLLEKGTEGLPLLGGKPDLMGVWLPGAYLKGAQLQQANLDAAQLQEANLWRAQLQWAGLERAQLKEANLLCAQLQEAFLYQAQLQKANLTKAQLKEADLSEAQLKEADLREAQLQKANLGGAKLQEANLSRANLQEANLRGAQLREANLTYTNLQKANLEQAALEEATLVEAELQGAYFNAAILTKANLKGSLQSLTNFKPPRTPATLAKSAWRAQAVASSAGKALYTQLTQGDGDDGDDGDGSASEDETEEGATREPPCWRAQAEQLVEQAVGGLVKVVPPVLELVEPMIIELENLCEKLSKGIPLTLVRLTRLPPGEPQPAEVAQHLDTLLRTCLVDPVFDVALVEMAAEVQQQLQEVLRRCEAGDAELSTPTMRDELLVKLQSSSKKVLDAQQLRFETLLQGRQSKGSRSPAPSAPAPVPTPTAAAPVAPPASALSPSAALPIASPAASEPSPLPQLAERTAVEAFVIEAMHALLTSLLEPLTDRKHGGDRLKEAALARLDGFKELAAEPICNVLAKVKQREAGQAATQLLELSGFLGTLKNDLCKSTLRKRVSQQLMAQLPTQHLGHGAERQLVAAGMFEQRLAQKLKALGDKAKLLQRHLTLGGIRGRAFEAVLKAATKYDVRVGGFEGSVDMVLMAWKRSRVELNTDENELQYLQDELAKLKEKEATASNWRDTAEGWISVLQLRGQLRVQCGHSVLDCMCSDEKMLEALGAAQALMQIQGDPPAALVTMIAQGPGAHIRKHAYRYTKRIAKELVLIQRVKQLQARSIAGLGTLLVATSVAVGNYFSRVMYDAATSGFGEQTVLTWVLPFAVLLGLLALVALGVTVYMCRKGIFLQTLRGCCCVRCCRPSGARGARVAPIGV